MSQIESPRISILGDGVSTFAGITLDNDLCSLYGAHNKSFTGLNTPEETWWMQVAQLMGGSILANNSVLASFVSHEGQFSATQTGRLHKLRTEEVEPDLILVYLGMTDVANNVPLDEFQHDYMEMLTKLKIECPQAEIWAGTIVTGTLASPDQEYSFPPEALDKLDSYNQLIRQGVKQIHCHLADFAADKLTFPTLDGYHPTAEGMTIFAKAWYEYLKD